MIEKQFFMLNYRKGEQGWGQVETSLALLKTVVLQNGMNKHKIL